MPDNKGSLATPPWNNHSFLLSKMLSKRFKIAANEWDAFDTTMFDIKGAVHCTTFRHPIDRQYIIDELILFVCKYFGIFILLIFKI